MKKIILFAAALAAFVACSKEQKSGTPFEKGQKVTLNIDASSSTKVTSADDGTNINFTWEEGDIIKVSVGGNDAEFTLKTGAGTSSATFEGEMPAGGDTFDVQYPYETPNLGNQTYSSTEAVPHDKMLLKATGCSIDNPTFSLTAQNAVIQLNLWSTNGYELGMIYFLNENWNSLARLTFDDGLTLPTTEANAKKIYMVVPAGNYNFIVDPRDNEDYDPYCYIPTSSAQTLTANQILNMPVKEVVIPQNSITYSTNPANKGQFNNKVTQSLAREYIDVEFEANGDYFIKNFEIKGVTTGRNISHSEEGSFFTPTTEFTMPCEPVTVKANCVQIKFESSTTDITAPEGQQSQHNVTITSTIRWDVESYDLPVSQYSGGTDGELTQTTITITVPVEKAEAMGSYSVNIQKNTETTAEPEDITINVQIEEV